MLKNFLSLFIIAPILIGCVDPIGDLGRKRPSILGTETKLSPSNVNLPFLHKGSHRFNYTNDERELRNMTWRLMQAPHVGNWIDTTSEWIRSLPYYDDRKYKERGIHRYYRLLRREPYRSSDARYARIADDALKDKALVTPLFYKAKTVFNADNKRLHAIRRMQGDILPGRLNEAHERMNDNRSIVAAAVAAMDYRIQSYRYAIDHLMIETPSEYGIQARSAVEELAVMIKHPQGLEYYAKKGPTDLRPLIRKY